MASKAKRQPAGRLDPEALAELERHDTVFSWLLDNLRMVVADRWGMKPAEVNASVEASRGVAVEWVESGYLADLLGLSSGTSVPSVWATAASWSETPVVHGDAAKALLASAASRVPEIASELREFVVEPTLGAASVRKYAAMMEVSLAEMRYGVEKRTGFGYIDVAATLFVPTSIELLVDGVERSPLNGSYVTHMHSEQQVAELHKAFVPTSVAARALGEEVTVWMSVRTEPFSLGQVLRELRVLKRIQGSSHTVALVVDGIEPGKRAHIEHEGFMVIDMQSYVPKVKKPRRKRVVVEAPAAASTGRLAPESEPSAVSA